MKWRPILVIVVLSALAAAGGDTRHVDTGKSVTSPNSEEKDVQELGVYLVRDPLYASELTNKPLSELTLAPRPVIASKDVVEYDTDTHTLLLTDEGYEKLLEIDVPVWGRPFIFTVNGRRVYLGAFWIENSSWPFGGIVILQPSIIQKEKTIKIQTGYPNQQHFEGQDLRSDPEIIEVLKSLKKFRGGKTSREGSTHSVGTNQMAVTQGPPSFARKWEFPTTLKSTDEFFAQRGFKAYDTLPDTRTIIALFAKKGGVHGPDEIVPTHSALYKGGDWWESKLGSSYRIVHKLKQLEGRKYGTVYRYYGK